MKIPAFHALRERIRATFENLPFNGEVTFARKHTANLLRDLSWLIAEMVSQLPAKFAEQSKVFERYRSAEITGRHAHDLIIRMVDKGAINVGDIRVVLREWREPKHPEFARDGKTAWRLFNATTEAIKGDIWRLPGRTTQLHAVLDAEFGIRTFCSLRCLPINGQSMRKSYRHECGTRVIKNRQGAVT